MDDGIADGFDGPETVIIRVTRHKDGRTTYRLNALMLEEDADIVIRTPWGEEIKLTCPDDISVTVTCGLEETKFVAPQMEPGTD